MWHILSDAGDYPSIYKLGYLFLPIYFFKSIFLSYDGTNKNQQQSTALLSSIPNIDFVFDSVSVSVASMQKQKIKKVFLLIESYTVTR